MDIKAECKRILRLYELTIWGQSRWVYGQTYEILPYHAKIAMRASAKEIMENIIYEMTEVV